MVKTWHLCRSGPGLIPGQGTKILQAAARKKKKERGWDEEQVTKNFKNNIGKWDWKQKKKEEEEKKTIKNRGQEKQSQ